ncbi:hypothetical protein WA1_30155 [Scytonema hofmannii PCC 7110]|uniref:Uncharacterized protein n=1 Tax=Scytonema hofmannii PCC 7110 TaxID=128403 RepID=A0A139X4I0_9CYAN|nr:hypothetical protein [Scytonema hofmannii]KYC39609.1 hypothetical protein WA1_30155 [Scytonema hofmannii PCC 7110]
MEKRTTEALMKAYLSLQRVVGELYAEMDYAIETRKYSDASLLQSQADKLYEMVENLETVIAEQEE